jgi:hypothetical protein
MRTLAFDERLALGLAGDFTFGFRGFLLFLTVALIVASRCITILVFKLRFTTLCCFALCAKGTSV